MTCTITTGEGNLGKAYQKVRAICDELEEAAEQASDDIGKRIAEIGARLSGWGSQSLDALVDAVERVANHDERGRSLEELIGRLFQSVPGFTVTGRVRTSTEEIDISILNDSSDPRLRRESALLLAECKNWSDRYGKNEFVLFKEKIENRSKRCTMGFLISWNGFKETVTKEMLRGSREDTLIVPLTGVHIRSAVRDSNFPDALMAHWEKAVNI